MHYRVLKLQKNILKLSKLQLHFLPQFRLLFFEHFDFIVCCPEDYVCVVMLLDSTFDGRVAMVLFFATYMLAILVFEVYVSHWSEHIILIVFLVSDTFLRPDALVKGHVAIILSLFLEIVKAEATIALAFCPRMVNRLGLKALEPEVLSGLIRTNGLVVSTANTPDGLPHTSFRIKWYKAAYYRNKPFMI